MRRKLLRDAKHPLYVRYFNIEGGAAAVRHPVRQIRAYVQTEEYCPEVCPFVEDYSVFTLIIGGGFHLVLSDERKETGQETLPKEGLSDDSHPPEAESPDVPAHREGREAATS